MPDDYPLLDSERGEVRSPSAETWHLLGGLQDAFSTEPSSSAGGQSEGIPVPGEPGPASPRSCLLAGIGAEPGRDFRSACTERSSNDCSGGFQNWCERFLELSKRRASCSCGASDHRGCRVILSLARSHTKGTGCALVTTTVRSVMISLSRSISSMLVNICLGLPDLARRENDRSVNTPSSPRRASASWAA
jgi:hypothetical protein